MAKNFRVAVFDLCKKLSKHPKSAIIRKTIHDMSVVIESKDDDPNMLKRPSHGDLAYIGSHQRIQFLGYLLADESVEDINKKQPFHATNLEVEERRVIEEAYKTIRLFIDLCIADVKIKYKKSSILLDPYFQYPHPQIGDGVVSFLGEDDVKECVDAFKAGKVYQKLINNESLMLLEKMDENTLRQLAALQKNQFSDDLKSTTKETEEYYRKVMTNSVIGMPDVLLTYSIYCYSLRESLEIAIQMIFEAIMGENMVVMNNDNIIDISNHSRGIVYDKYVVLIQDVLWGVTGNSVGSIALLSCNPTDTHHLKEFGLIVALTVSFQNEFGDTSKVTIVTVDEELNDIHIFTDAIMNTVHG